MYHFIYKTTCKLTNKYYIGRHTSSVVEDGYFGSGYLLMASLKKHGKENHTREVLEFHPDVDTLRLRERDLVNEELLQDPLCMNLVLGGDGWEFVNHKLTAEQRTARKEAVAAGLKRFYESNPVGKQRSREKILAYRSSLTTDEFLALQSKAGKNGGGSNKLSLIEVQARLEQIKDVDLTRFGWVSKVAKILECSHTQARRFVTQHVEGQIFKRISA